MSAALLAALFASGAATGCLGAMLGIGGAVFLVPALILGFGIRLNQAAGAGLIAVIATSCAAAAFNVGKGTANVRIGVVLETATVLGALGGGLCAAVIPERTLTALFAALLGVVAALLWRGAVVGDEGELSEANGAGRFDGNYLDAATGRRVAYALKRLPLALGSSFAAGGLSGLLGVGGGILKVPVLHLYCGMPMKAAAATSNLMIGVTASTGAILYFRRGWIDPQLSGVLALGVLAGSRLGIRLAERLRDSSLRRSFAILSALLAAAMLRRALLGG